MPKKIITGDFDGEPIWRYETAGEKLAQELEDAKRKDLPTETKNA